jgi:hypothetical protein
MRLESLCQLAKQKLKPGNTRNVAKTVLDRLLRDRACKRFLATRVAEDVRKPLLNKLLKVGSMEKLRTVLG